MVSRSDPWHCPRCGAQADLAPRWAEVAMVRLAVMGENGFKLGSAGVEPAVAPLLETCDCGGRFVPGAGEGLPARAVFRPEALRPVVEAGYERLQAGTDETLVRLRAGWEPRLLALLGRESEIPREQVLRLRLEAKLERLQHEVELATAQGDQDTAEAAHARYIELGTTYVRRFVATDERVEAS
jgi:hypothetical protein